MNNLPSDAPRREQQVIRNFHVYLVAVADDFGITAEGTLPSSDFGLSVRPEFSGSPLALPGTGFPNGLACSEKHFLSLVIEIGTSIDLIELWQHEGWATPVPPT